MRKLGDNVPSAFHCTNWLNCDINEDRSPAVFRRTPDNTAEVPRRTIVAICCRFSNVLAFFSAT